jgi:hypothetical protein
MSSEEIPPELREDGEQRDKPPTDEIDTLIAGLEASNPNGAKAIKNLREQLERERKRVEMQEEQASELLEAARRSSTERIEAESHLAQISDLVEGLFRGVISIPRISARLALRAYTAERNLKDAYNLLTGKTNWLPIIVVIGLFGLVGAVVLSDPVGFSAWISTPAGELVSVIVAIVGAMAAYRYLFRG